MNLVLPSTRPIVDNAQHVTIDDACLEQVAQEWAPGEFKVPAWDFPPYPASDENIVDFLFWGNTINFCFTNFAASGAENVKYTVEFEGKPQEGSSAMWASMRKAVNEYGDRVLTGAFWRDITRARAWDIFHGIDNAHDIPMFEERRHILHHVGDVLARDYALGDGGRFSHFVDDCAKGSVLRLYGPPLEQDGLVERLTREFPSFQDQVWKSGLERPVFFDKRAQLAAAMAWGRSQNRGGTIFEPVDVDQLTVFADYQLPKVLRALGILQYDDWLARKVDGRRVIDAGSWEELEIRAATVHAADRLIKRINALTGKGINAVHMDYKIFSAGRKMGHEIPHHYTTTTAY